MSSLLEINNLYAEAEGKQILKGLNLKINKGETHVIMGPNGAGKSTTANVILNNPEYKKTSGEILFEGENINEESTDKIAKKGVFMSFQSPVEIPGISTFNFLKYAKNKDVVVCASDLMAIGAMNALIDMDIFRPVCGFDGITLMGYVGKQMNTIRQDFYSISSRAVEDVHQLMNGGEGHQVIMPHSIVKMYYKDIIC